MNNNFEYRRYLLKRKQEKLKEERRKNISVDYVAHRIITLKGASLFGDYDSEYMNIIKDAFNQEEKTFGIDFGDMHPLEVGASIKKINIPYYKVKSILCSNFISQADFKRLYDFLINYFNYIYEGKAESIELAKKLAEKVYAEDNKSIYKLVSSCYIDQEDFENNLRNVFACIEKQRINEPSQTNTMKK